ncbi:MAG: ribosome biogenesis GTPase Der [Candidatus Abawacabacteria bacterium]|nr:ribosome biogenesis GTPase Der [Candidatus Abawacabacteria bacterium]
MENFVALIGRPNVGKSTLFNRILGFQKSITHKQAGTTLDVLYGTVETPSGSFILADCPGVFENFSDPLNVQAQERALALFQKAALLVLVMDTTLPPSKEDRTLVQWLRKHDQHFIVCATKADQRNSEEHIAAIEQLTGQEAYPVAALQGGGIDRLILGIKDFFITNKIPLLPDTANSPKPDIKVALLGRPNAGKSTLFNYLAGEELSLVSDIPGTTRDPLDVITNYPELNMSIQWIDTAGLRRRAKIADNIEYISYLRSHKVIEQCDIAVLLISAENMVVHRDETIIQYILEQRKGLVIVVTKSDIVSHEVLKKFEQEMRYILQYAKWAPIVPLSVHEKKGVDNLLHIIQHVAAQYSRTISTQKINKFLEYFQSLHTAPLIKGKRAKMYYGLQTDTKPPHFLFFVNDDDVFRFSHVRAIENNLRQYFELEGTPVIIEYRSRREKTEE